MLSIGLVLATTLAVAAAAHAVIDGLSWPAAFVLGAVPDTQAPGRPAGRAHAPFPERDLITFLSKRARESFDIGIMPAPREPLL